MPKKNEPLTSTEDKLDVIVECLHRMDRRDRLRAWGGFLRGMLSLIPILAFVLGSWYFYQHGDELMVKIAKTAAEQASEVTKQGTESMMEQLQNFKIR